MAFWILMILLLTIGVSIGLTTLIADNTEEEYLEIWMAPGSGRIFLYNPETRMMENDEYGKAEVSGNTDEWILEKIGEL